MQISYHFVKKKNLNLLDPIVPVPLQKKADFGYIGTGYGYLHEWKIYAICTLKSTSAK